MRRREHDEGIHPGSEVCEARLTSSRSSLDMLKNIDIDDRIEPFVGSDRLQACPHGPRTLPGIVPRRKSPAECAQPIARPVPRRPTSFDVSPQSRRAVDPMPAADVEDSQPQIRLDDLSPSSPSNARPSRKGSSSEPSYVRLVSAMNLSLFQPKTQIFASNPRPRSDPPIVPAAKIQRN